MDAGPSACDVVGCNESAAGTYLDARGSQLLEFGICPAHHVRLQQGVQPVIVAERFGLADVDGHPALLLD
jgi:hypothetical protein